MAFQHILITYLMKDKHIAASFHQHFEIDYALIPDILGIMPFRKHYYNFDLL